MVIKGIIASLASNNAVKNRMLGIKGSLNSFSAARNAQQKHVATMNLEWIQSSAQRQL